MKKTLLTLASTLLVGFAATTATASNMSFLNETPAKYYSDQDWEIMSNAQDKTLNSAPDNKKVTWKNSQSGHGGYFIASNTTHQKGQTCRRLKTFMDANGLTTAVHFHYCKIHGEWKIVTQDA